METNADLKICQYIHLFLKKYAKAFTFQYFLVFEIQRFLISNVSVLKHKLFLNEHQHIGRFSSRC